MFYGVGGEKKWIFYYCFQLLVLCTGWLFFCRGKEQGWGGKSCFFHQVFLEIFPCRQDGNANALFAKVLASWQDMVLNLNLCLWAVISSKNEGYFLHIGIFLKEHKRREKRRKIKGSNISLLHTFFFILETLHQPCSNTFLSASSCLGIWTWLPLSATWQLDVLIPAD